ncbi:MAG: alpha/beta hydrolase [Halioglobus sp.]
MKKEEKNGTKIPAYLPFVDIDRPNELVSENAEASPSGVSAQGKIILDYVNSQPTIIGVLPERVRELRRAKENSFDHTPQPTVKREDIEVSGAAGNLLARVYRPANGKNHDSPAIMYFHGGGFVLGDIESYDNFIANLAHESNLTTISVSYRLAPETPFPGAVDDACSAFLWLVKNAENLGINPSKIALGGDSAGGNLAASVCILHRDQKKPLPAFQLLIYPTTIANDTSESRVQFAQDLLLTKDSIEWFHDHYIPRSKAKDTRFHILSVENHENLPPAFVLTGGFDPLRDEGKAYAEKLRCSGVPVRHSCYTDMFHAFINFGFLTQSQEAIGECAAVLKSALYAD